MNRRYEEDDQMLFDRIQDMNLAEAEVELKIRVAELTDSIRYAEPNSNALRKLVNAREMLRIELHRICTINNNHFWQRAIEAVYGADGLEKVRVQLEFERGLPYASPEQRTHEIKVAPLGAPQTVGYGKLVPLRK